MAKNLNMRDWIETLQKAGELVTLTKPVDPEREMGALLYKSREKALFFNEVKGYPGWRALGQAPDGYRLAITLDAYSERGWPYLAEVRLTIRANRLTQLDRAWLDAQSTALLLVPET